MYERGLVVLSVLGVAGCVEELPTYSEVASPLTVSVGTETAVDTAVPSSPVGTASRAGNVAFSGAQYLAVWQDSRTGSPVIWATRMTTLGAITDTTALRISASTLTGDQAEPTVTFSNGRYVVVWEDRGAGQLRAATITTAGVITQLGTLGAGTKPRLATRSTEALLAYESAGDIYGARFAGTFAAPFAIASTATAESEPAVGANPAGGFLVSFTSGAVGVRQVHGQLVNPAGASPLVGAPIAIATGWREHYQSDVGFVGGNFLVTWTYRNARIAGTRVTTAGVVLDTHLEDTIAYGGIPLTAENSDLSNVDCSASTSKCFVTWRRRILGSDGNATDVEGQLFDASLVASGGVVTVSGGVGVQGAPAVVAAASGSFFTVFNDDRHNAGGSVFGSRISSAGAVQDANGILVARGNNFQGAPVAARSSLTWLVSWTDSRSIGNNIQGGRINNGGIAFDVPGFTLGGGQYGQADAAIAVNGAAGGTSYMVVWTDRQSRHADIYGSTVQQFGTAPVSTNVAIATAADDQGAPEIAADASGGYLVAWQDRRNLATTRNDIYAALVTATGTVAVGDIVVTNALGNQVLPQVGYDAAANLYLLVWTDSTTNTLYGARVDTAGNVLDPGGVALIAGGGVQEDLVIASGSDRFLFAWREGDTVKGARLRVSSTQITVDDASGFTIASGSGSRKNPTIAYLGDVNRHFFVAWADGRNAGNGMDIYGVSVVEDTGALDGSAAQLVGGTTDETSPKLAAGHAVVVGQNVEVLLTYQRYNTTLANQRVYMRKLSYTNF